MSTFTSHVRAFQPARRGRAAAATLLLFALVAVAVVAGAVPARAADGAVVGTVFRDFNGNGRFDAGSAGAGEAADRGLAGVTVTATDGLGNEWTTTTGANGAYTINVAGSFSEYVRIEFSNWDPQFEPSGTSAAGTNGTSVQFVSIDEAADAVADFALNAPEEYSQDNPSVLVPIQRAGSPSLAEGGTLTGINAPAIVGLPYDNRFTASPQPANFPGRVTLATFGDVGAISSVAFQSSSNSLFAFATYKRQSGLGALGLGGIYRVTDVVGVDGNVSSAGDVEPWLDVTDPSGLNINLGTALSNSARGISGPTTPANDTHGFANSAKIGFGGVALSPDGNTLYFVNLYDKRLYSLDVSDVDNPPTTYQSYDLDLDDNERPWAVSIYRDRVYVGYVETGETDAGPQPGQSAAAADLHAYVKSAPVGALNGSWDTVLTAGLGYAKGDVYNNALVPQSQQWNTWTDTWTWTGGRVSQNNGGWHIYPQPVLSGLYFDENGYVTLGFTDRSAIQGGNRNLASDPAVTGTNYETGSSGDILLAAPVGDGTFVLENNAVVGARTGTTGGNNEGPGGREFYNDRLNIGAGSTHREVTLGSVAGLRGSGEVVSSAYDPLSGIRLAGLAWYKIDNGTAVAGYEVTVDGGGGPSADGGFQKGGGLGAVSLLARSAPVEIGNRVWFDADQDGIQDADEPHVVGLTVELYDAGGTLIATKITDANGEYVFRSDEDGFDPAGDYTVVFVKPTTGTVTLGGPNAGAFGALAWEDVDFTEQGGGGPLDSDADPVTGEAPVTIVGPGYNDHTIDAGFTANVDFTVTKVIDADGAPAGAGQKFTITLAARDFRGQALSAPTSVELGAGETSAAISLPVGASVLVTETGSFRDVAITGPDGADHDDYYPLTGTGTTFAFTVTNTLFEPGTFTITKSVSGPAASLVDGDTEFTFEYTTDPTDDDSWLALSGFATADGSTTVTSPSLPYGTVVTIREQTPEIDGVAWETPEWAIDGGTAVTGNTVEVTIGDDTDVALAVNNPTGATPRVDIEKGDGANGAILHDADTMADGEYYADGETREIVLQVTNNGTEDLREVLLTDETLSGAQVTAIEWTFPDGTSTTSTLVGGVWTARWEATFDPGTTVWEPRDVITGTATLTVRASDAPHVDRVNVSAAGATSGTPVEDSDDYNAFSAGIQVIKYDGDSDDPQVRDGDDWIIPSKPLANASQDANDEGTAVRYGIDEPRTVRWVVTNTGTTWLTDIDLTDVTTTGPAVSSWTADLSDFGGPADYDFVTEGTWHGLLPPGASFFAEGTLTLGADVKHANTVTVAATPVVPEVDENGVPTGQPQLDDQDNPVLATGPDDNPVRLTDADPFHAFTRSEGDGGTGGNDDDLLSGTGVDIPVVGLLLIAIAAVGAGLVMVYFGRRHRA